MSRLNGNRRQKVRYVGMEPSESLVERGKPTASGPGELREVGIGVLTMPEDTVHNDIAVTNRSACADRTDGRSASTLDGVFDGALATREAGYP
ncbi:hypothetical protein [Saccharomonospora sp.]|uniref:hypothetical protein n=1 Tax=Saccharomonospora sp. TaxID=33913 RepID=UPI002633484F|nr:hypothetical protein [Saccharomonospora sp.]